METNQIEENRAEAFRQFHAEQLQKQTKHLDTIKTLMIMWTVLAAVGFVLSVIAAVGS